jgi:hypothetical protein
MKLVSEYLERAQEFEHLAASEKDPKTKQKLTEQVAAYKELAAQRAKQTKVPRPARA